MDAEVRRWTGRGGITGLLRTSGGDFSLMKTIRERITNKVRVDNVTGCWLWVGCIGHHGYGHIKVDQKVCVVHRVMWQIQTQKTIDHGVYICHSCDNPTCCNPEHVWEGTSQHNVFDMMAKGRTPGLSITHCPSGHAYSKANTYWVRSKLGRGRRVCKLCSSQWSRANYLKMKKRNL